MRKIVNHVRYAVVLASLATAPLFMNGQDQSAPDNTKQNKANTVTADEQKNDKSDRITTQKIRKAIVSDKSLSTYAHNIKIITVHGTVSLKGPVRSNEEKTAIEAKAAEIAGAANVTSNLTVAPKNSDKN